MSRNVGEPEPFPADLATARVPTHNTKRKSLAAEFANATYADGTLGTIGSHGRFLTWDRKVLRFYCSWTDDRLFGNLTYHVSGGGMRGKGGSGD